MSKKRKIAIGHIERLDPGNSRMKDLYQAGIAKYRFAAKYTKGKVILDAGCGMGYGSNFLSRHGVDKVIAIDKSKEAINYAKNHYKNKNIEYKVMDCTNMSFKDNYFDTVISFEVIEHLPNPKIYLKVVKRVLKKGGIFVLSTPNKIYGSWKNPNPYHKHEYEYRELMEILGEYFSSVKIYGFDIAHPQAIEYKKASEKLEMLSGLSKRFLALSKLVPKGVKNIIFDNITPVYPDLHSRDFRISLKDPVKDRVFIAVAK